MPEQALVEQDFSQRVRKILDGDLRSVARALTQVESRARDPETIALLKGLFPFTGRALILGVTGSPGAGKSTLVNQLIRALRGEGKSVGVIAVDPTSPFSGGAVLGDRVRMQDFSSDPRVFIRSMATRGQMGGLAPSVQEALLVLDAAGYDVLIVETVGVGQDEVDIVRTADVSIVVLVPGMGDDVQTIKAGIMEIGDVFVINKSDREGAERTEQELKALLGLGVRPDGWTPPIVRTVATRGDGTAELLRAIADYRNDPSRLEADGRRHCEFLRNRLLSTFRETVTDVLLRQVPEADMDSMVRDMADRKSDPYTMVDRLLARLGLKTDEGEET